MANTPVDPIDVFFRRHPSMPVPQQEMRSKLKLSDVPESEEGLRLLAAENCWGTCAQLADVLLNKVPRGGSSSSGATASANREQFLRLLLVRVTALCQVGEYKKASGALEMVGNPAAAENCHPDTGVSLIPFSLSYVGARLPLALGDRQKALDNMYRLLDETILREKALTGVGKETVKWRDRQRRVRRCLVVLHQDLRQFDPAVSHLNSLIDMSADISQQMLLLQQIGILALKNGNGFVATANFKKMKHLVDDDDEATPVVVSFCKFLSELNDALLAVFFGDYDVAVELFKKLMLIDPFTGEPLKSGSTTAGSSPTTVVGSSPYNVAAANGFLVCHQYASDDTRYNLRTAVAFAETAIKAHPKQMLHSDALLYNAKAIHNLENDEGMDKASLLKAVTDRFRCGSECFPVELIP